MEKMDKAQRKEFVKSQRKKFSENPSNFLKDEIVTPTIKYWKETPLKAFGTFILWVFIYYTTFAGIQAFNNDIIYCKSPIEMYNGKIMYVYNDFVREYNIQSTAFNQKLINIPITSGSYSDIIQRNDMINNFNSEWKIECKYNWSRWVSEPVSYKMETISTGMTKIYFKQK